MSNENSQKIQKWVFSLDQRSENWFKDCIKVAVVSALKNTSLSPVCLFDGRADSSLVAWMRDAGVDVILHEVCFKTELYSDKVISANTGTPYNPAHAAGAYLRVEAARLIEDAYFLYTDCDIMFTKDPAELFQFPNLFAASPEVVQNGRYFGETSSFNSGIMIINKQNFLAVEDSFIDYCRARNFYDRQHYSYDQTHLNRFFDRKWEKLSPFLNWRPFQGDIPAASIVHFHGPKPHRIDKILRGEASPEEALEMKDLIDGNPGAYAHFIAVFYDYLTKSSQLVK